MARRSAPPGSGPSYISPSYGGAGARRGQLDHDTSDESTFSRFVREQITAPQYLPGNISIVTGIVVFAAGVAALRQWGEVLTFGV